MTDGDAPQVQDGETKALTTAARNAALEEAAALVENVDGHRLQHGPFHFGPTVINRRETAKDIRALCSAPPSDEDHTARLWALREEMHQLGLNTANHKLRTQYQRWGSVLAIGLIELRLTRDVLKRARVQLPAPPPPAKDAKP